MRAFFLLLLLMVVADGLLMYLFDELSSTGGSPQGFYYWLALSFDDVFPPRLFSHAAGTEIVGFIRKINGLLGYVLLGLIFHAIREAFRDHNLRVSKFIFLATGTEARR